MVPGVGSVYLISTLSKVEFQTWDYTDGSIVQKYENNSRPLGKDSHAFVETIEAHCVAQMEAVSDHFCYFSSETDNPIFTPTLH